MAQQKHAIATQTTHHPINDRRRGPGALVNSQITASGRADTTMVAFTPPISATATADLAAARIGDPSRAPTTKGCNTHGKKTTANRSAEIAAQSTTIGATQ